jgi:putative ABC transport system substrate-binding protein
MRRREVIAGLGATAAWPLAANAQPSAVPTIGFLSSRSPAESAPFEAAFRQGLKEAGSVEGENLHIAFRWADGRYARLPELAADLVQRRVSVIVTAGGEVAAFAAKAATTSIPIVFVAGSDPVETGLVASFNEPGGNLTGVSMLTGALGAKRLALLRELVPGASVIALLVNPASPNAARYGSVVQEAARTLEQKILAVEAGADADFEPAFASAVAQGAHALIASPDAFFNNRRERVVALAKAHALPAIYETREFAEVGGLMSYGTNYAESYRQAGIYAGRILKGARPGDLPVLQPIKFELVINLKTAKALGLAIPSSLLARADEVVE